MRVSRSSVSGSRSWLSRLSVTGAVAVAAGLLAPVAPALADPVLPTVTITSPSSGAGAEGPLSVVAYAILDAAAADSAVSITLLVDGATGPGGPADCASQPDPTTRCDATFTFDPAGLPVGAHTLVAELQTTSEGFVDSAPVTVVVPAAPSVAFTSVPNPMDGPTDIAVLGDTDPVSADLPASVSLDWGATPLGSLDCPMPLQHSCPLTFSYDMTGLNETHDLVATMQTTSGALPPATAIDTAVEASSPAPKVSIDSPSDGAAEKGRFSVTATGTVQGRQSDSGARLELFVNSGSTPEDTYTCPAGRTCSGGLTWDATGRADGHYTLYVRFTTTRGRSATDSIQVDVTSPRPTVAITTPVDGDTVTGNVRVHADAAVDGSQTDSAEGLTLLVNGAAKDTAGCPADSRSCSADLVWDASGVNGNRDLTVVFTTTRGRSVTSAASTVKVTTAPPTAGISSPVNGATVSGVVSVVTTGTVNARQSDTPATMQLLVDGTAVSGPQACTGASSTAKTCSLPYTWDTTGLSGQHTVQAKFVTRKGFTGLSPISTVTVLSPLPRAAVTSPALNATVHRLVTITASGAVDPSQSDTASSLQLALDGKPLGGPLACTTTSADRRTCSATYGWNTLGLTGRHTITATVTTAKGKVGSSSATSVYVYGGTKTALVALKTQHYGKATKVTGRVTALINRSSVAGVKVKVLLVPAVGHAKTVYVRTNTHGYFTVSFKPSLNTTVEATVVPPAYYGTSHTFTKVKVLPRATCTVGHNVGRNRLDSGTCKIPNLAKGTRVTLQYGLKGHWYTIGVGKAKGGTVPFTFRFAARGTYAVRLVLGSSKVFVGATTPSMKVVVT